MNILIVIEHVVHPLHLSFLELELVEINYIFNLDLQETLREVHHDAAEEQLQWDQVNRNKED
jgi:hypothetical protein